MAAAVTVVVPTRDRPEALGRCLAALTSQTCPGVEAVVVDDGSADAAAVERAAAAGGARLVRLPGRGAAAARNAGVDAARGDVVCFTDDDCEPAPEWAARLVARIRAGAGAAAGRTVAADPHDRLAAAAETIAGHLAEHARAADGTTSFSATNNVACRLDVAQAVRFDESFPAAGGEDRDWCARLVAAGHRIEWTPDALVAHRPALTLAGFWRQQAAYGAGSSRFRRGSGAPAVERLPFYARLLRRGFEQGAAVGTLVVASQLAAATGVARDRVSAGGRAGRSSAAPPLRAR